MPDHRLVLTFDGGPDPTWAPRVLDMLEKHHHAHAMLRHRHDDLPLPGSGQAHGGRRPRGGPAHLQPPPPLLPVQEAHRLGAVPDQLTLTGAAGIRTSLFPPPYSSSADAMDNKSCPVTEYIGARGYITVGNDTDSEDWQKPGVDTIIRNATPHGGKGTVVPMHDSGGDRHHTVQALDRVVPMLQKQATSSTFRRS